MIYSILIGLFVTYYLQRVDGFIPSHHHAVLSVRSLSHLKVQPQQLAKKLTKKQRPHETHLYLKSSSSSSSQSNDNKLYKHTLAILTLPVTSSDRVANTAILQKAISCTAPSQKLSVVLRCRDDDTAHSLPALRRYVGEIYSVAWDLISTSESSENLLNLIVYPQSLPNTPPEQWIHHRTDLDCVCSHDSIIGWHSVGSGKTSDKYQTQEGNGYGGLNDHVDAMNADRTQRGLQKVEALHVTPWPIAAQNNLKSMNESNEPNKIVFLEDDEEYTNNHDIQHKQTRFTRDSSPDTNEDSDDDDESYILNGPIVHDSSLFSCVAVGGTFDGMHYGHRKLLTLAISSVIPPTSISGTGGQLLVGVTSDEMLTSKTLSEKIAPIEQRLKGVQEFLDQLAPGMKNMINIVKIEDALGPPAFDPKFDALVLSDEVLENGIALNKHRRSLGMKEMTLLCTRRTEANAMSSTALRKWKDLTTQSNNNNKE